jgi:hypothetical protein
MLFRVTVPPINMSGAKGEGEGIEGLGLGTVKEEEGMSNRMEGKEGEERGEGDRKVHVGES